MRVVPAHRKRVRRFLGRVRGHELEVALEATTGWQFLVEELDRVGARVHLAEPGGCLAIARKLLERSYHTLRELGEQAIAPA